MLASYLVGGEFRRHKLRTSDNKCRIACPGRRLAEAILFIACASVFLACKLVWPIGANGVLIKFMREVVDKGIIP